MSKKELIILGIIILIFIILAYENFFKTKNKNEIPIEQGESSNWEREDGYDDYTGLYYIRDKETGEILFTSRNQEELDFYKEHPDYNPNPLSEKETDIADFILVN